MRLATRPHTGTPGPRNRYLAVPTPRRPPPVRLLTLAVVVLVAAGLVAVTRRHPHDGFHNVTVAPGLKIYPFEGRYYGHSEPGTLDLTTLVGFQVTAPLTLLDAEPYAVSPGVETISRAYFYGFGTSASGRRMFNGVPGEVCYAGPWPPLGYGRSWPVPGLTLAPGDPVKIGYFIRPPARAGDYRVTGYRIKYRTANGKVHTVTGDLGHDDIYSRTPADLAKQGVDGCLTPPHDSWYEPMAGYPS